MPSTATQIGLWESYLDYQRTYMALRNFAEATRRGYASDLRLFVMHLADNTGVRTVQEVQRAHLHGYFATLDRQGQAGATRARRLAAVKSFFGYLADCGLIAHNLARGIPRPKQEIREPRVPTEEEYRRLRHACRDHHRDKAIIELLLQAGLRLSEVAGLAVADLELPSDTGDGGIGAVRVMGKGRKRRTVTLN